MNAEIIAIGSELLLGETIDTNSAYLARQLTTIGINLFLKTVIGDNETRIANAINAALDRADLVICTGGLGPTVDDMTRDAVARALDRPLVFHQHLLDQIEARFRAFGRVMSESNRRQAYVPSGARIVENPRGTAPAFIVEAARPGTNGTVVVLPGVPAEMRYLWENAILPYLRNERDQTSVILVRTLHAAGTSESRIGELVADLMEQANPTLGISAKRGQFELRIGARAENEAEANALADATAAIIQERIGEFVIGTEGLNDTVLQQLGARGLSLALDEGTVNAPVYHALSANTVNNSLLRGVCIHPLLAGADNSEDSAITRATALETREQWHSDLGLCVRPSAASATDSFTSVFVALAHPSGVIEASRRFDLNLDEGWGAVVTLALEVLRQFLETR